MECNTKGYQRIFVSRGINSVDLYSLLVGESKCVENGVNALVKSTDSVFILRINSSETDIFMIRMTHATSRAQMEAKSAIHSIS
jgi:hypothetical protein